MPHLGPQPISTAVTASTSSFVLFASLGLAIVAFRLSHIRPAVQRQATPGNISCKREFAIAYGIAIENTPALTENGGKALARAWFVRSPCGCSCFAGSGGTQK